MAAAQVVAAAIGEMGNARVIATLFDGLSRALAPEVEPGGGLLKTEITLLGKGSGGEFTYVSVKY